MGWMLRREFGASEPLEDVVVFGEYHDSERRGVPHSVFNPGFLFRFYDRHVFQHPPRTKAMMMEVLPQAIGAEIFLCIDPETRRPLDLNMPGGGAFTRRNFSAYIESACQTASRVMSARAVSLFSAARYCRIVIVGDRLTVLASDETPPKRQIPTRRIEIPDHLLLDICEHNSKVVSIDGWVKVEVPGKSDWRLAALPKGSA